MSKTIHCQCVICYHNKNYICELEEITISPLIPKCESFILCEENYKVATKQPWVDIFK